MQTVSMSVHHGDCRHTETATAPTIPGALAELNKTGMGIGYGPKAGTFQFDVVCCQLQEKGEAQYGWADFRIIILDAVQKV